MESIYCETLPKSGILMPVSTRITAMSNALKQYGLGILIAGVSLLPLTRSFAQAGPNPGDGSNNGKAQTEWVVDGKTYYGAGRAGNAASRGGRVMSMVVYKGQDNISVADEKIVNYYEKYMRDQGANGKVFVESLPSAKQTGYEFNVNGELLDEKTFIGDEFQEALVKAINLQKSLSTNTVARVPYEQAPVANISK